MGMLWTGLEADYVRAGNSPVLERYVKGLLAFPDVALYWDVGAPQVFDSQFRAYVTKRR